MTTTFDTLTLSLPAHWLPALVNADLDGLDEAEAVALARWERDMIREIGSFHIGDTGADSGPHFARYHDAAEYGVLACDCYDVQLVFHPAPAERAYA